MSYADHLDELDELLRLKLKLGLSRRKIEEGVSPPLSPRVMETLFPIAADVLLQSCSTAPHSTQQQHARPQSERAESRLFIYQSCAH
jgi:hypothetical protein